MAAAALPVSRRRCRKSARVAPAALLLLLLILFTVDVLTMLSNCTETWADISSAAADALFFKGH